jgi:hypothetical protein
MIHQYVLATNISIPPFFNFGPEYIEHSFRFTEFRTSVKAGKFYCKTQHLKWMNAL